MEPKSKKGLKRRRTKYPGLDPSVHPRNRREYIDYDYTDKLSAKDKKWLSNFTEEFVGGSFQHKGKKLHKTKAERKICYDKVNARNRDMYSKGLATRRLHSIDDYHNTEDPNHNEDALIAALDITDEKT